MCMLEFWIKDVDEVASIGRSNCWNGSDVLLPYKVLGCCSLKLLDSLHSAV